MPFAAEPVLDDAPPDEVPVEPPPLVEVALELPLEPPAVAEVPVVVEVAVLVEVVPPVLLDQVELVPPDVPLDDAEEEEEDVVLWPEMRSTMRLTASICAPLFLA